MGPADHVHNFSGFLPELRLSEGLAIPTYFVIISIAFCVCLIWLVRRTDRSGLDRNTALDIALIVMGFGFLGARLFHVIFEEPSYYAEDPLRIFEFWRGGFVWFGGAIFATLAGLLYVRRKHLALGTWLDIVAPVAALGYALGRVACVLAGCCYGDICILPSGWSFRYPTQVFAVAWEFALLAVLLWLERKRLGVKVSSWISPPGQLFVVWLGGHSFGRLIMEIFRADPRGPEPLGLSLASWISLVLIAGTSAVFFRRARGKMP